MTIAIFGFSFLVSLIVTTTNWSTADGDRLYLFILATSISFAALVAAVVREWHRIRMGRNIADVAEE